MSDFERRLQQLVVERVDAELGPRRPPPPFAPGLDEVYPVAGRLQRLTSRPVLLALVAAACIVAILVGSIGLSQLSADRPTPPAVPTPTPSPIPSVTSTPSATASVPPAAPTSGAAPAAGPTVTLAGARLTLPPGWVARPMPRTLAGPAGSATTTWCLMPSSAQIGPDQFGCPLMFARPEYAAGWWLDGNGLGGIYGDASYCTPSAGATVQGADGVLGGRSADYRVFHTPCSAGGGYLTIQYVVPTGPGFLLVSLTRDGSPAADRAREDLIAQIAHQAVLPRPTDPVRLYDWGYVRRTQSTSAGERVWIDRVIPGTKGPVNTNPATYEYLIPSSVLKRESSITITTGQLAHVYSDGHHLLAFTAGP